MSNIKWFSIGFGALFGATVGVVATAATGDLIYEHHTGRKEISAQQAACFAACARNAGITDIANADLISACAQRDELSTSGFSAQVVGLKSSSAKNLPVSSKGITVVGIAE
jgi:hypothetical protein